MRQEAITLTKTNIGPDICHHMAPLGHNEFSSNSFLHTCFNVACSDVSLLYWSMLVQVNNIQQKYTEVIRSSGRLKNQQIHSLFHSLSRLTAAKTLNLRTTARLWEESMDKQQILFRRGQWWESCFCYVMSSRNYRFSDICWFQWILIDIDLFYALRHENICICKLVIDFQKTRNLFGGNQDIIIESILPYCLCQLSRFQ